MDKIRLHGFNNLTKTLSFNIYDVCYACSDAQINEYMDYIDDAYNAERLTQILQDVANIIGANILNIMIIGMLVMRWRMRAAFA